MITVIYFQSNIISFIFLTRAYFEKPRVQLGFITKVLDVDSKLNMPLKDGSEFGRRERAGDS